MRPVKKVLLSLEEGVFVDEVILESAQIYTVYYKKQPIAIRYYKKGKKVKTMYNQTMHFTIYSRAENLCLQLNIKFNTTDFEVVALGRKVNSVKLERPKRSGVSWEDAVNNAYIAVQKQRESRKKTNG